MMVRYGIGICWVTVISVFWMLTGVLPLHARAYTVGLVEWAPWATTYVAAEKGFWKSEGLDGVVVKFEDYAQGSVRAFKYGKTDFSAMMLGSSGAFHARWKG